MKIVYLSSRLKAGYFGTEKFLENLLTELKSDEHIFIGSDGPINNIFKDKGFEQYDNSGGFEVDGWKKRFLAPVSIVLGIIEIIKFRKIFSKADIIVLPASVLSESVFVGPWIRLFWPKKPIVQIIHKNDCPDFIAQNPFLPLAKFSWNGGGLFFVSQSQKDLWKSKKVQAKNNFVILNGVKIYPYKPSSKHDHKIISMGFLGRIHNDKGLKTLFKALSQLKIPKELTVNFKIAGEGEHYDEIYEFFKSLSYPKNLQIEWLGYLKNTQQFYESLNLFVCPSNLESFGLVMAESWERGIPVLCSDIDAFLELKANQSQPEKDLIFKAGNYLDLSSKIDYFINNRELYLDSANKKSLHDFTLQNFSNPQMAAKYRSIFLKLITKQNV